MEFIPDKIEMTEQNLKDKNTCIQMQKIFGTDFLLGKLRNLLTYTLAV